MQQWEATFLDGVVVEAIDIGEESKFVDDGLKSVNPPLLTEAIDIGQNTLPEISAFDEPVGNFPQLAPGSVSEEKGEGFSRPICQAHCTLLHGLIVVFYAHTHRSATSGQYRTVPKHS
jgi:hypothetical protein